MHTFQRTDRCDDLVVLPAHQVAEPARFHRAPSAQLQRLRAKKLQAPMVACGGAVACLMGAAVAVGLHGALGASPSQVAMLYDAITPAAAVGAQVGSANAKSLAWRLSPIGPMSLDTLL